MRLAFLGTPSFAAPALEALLDAGHEIAAVYSQPPRPRGRGQGVRPSPVEILARSRGLEVRTPASMRDAAEVAAFQALGLEAAVVVAYGQILPAAILDAPRHGGFNLHASLLPRWRGAAPIQRAIMAGDADTGVQVMRMTSGLDEGAILATARTAIAADDTAGSLAARLSAAGAALLAPTLAAVARGEAIETPQSGDPLYARKITVADTRLDWSRPAAEVDRAIRGLSPAPGAWFEAPSAKGSLRVKAWLSAVEPDDLAFPGASPGDRLARPGLVVACGTGAVRLLRLQREGRGEQDTETFLRGSPLASDARLG